MIWHDTIIRGDNRDALHHVPNGSVDLIITSPPYNCGKDYGTHDDAGDEGIWWSTQTTWLLEAHRLLKEGGRLAVNLPWWMGKKPKREVPFKFHDKATRCGFTFMDKILWVKSADGNNVHSTAGCAWGTYLSPSGPSMRCTSEPILIFSKGHRGRGEPSKDPEKWGGHCKPGDITAKEWAEWTLDTWFMHGATDPMHPAVFPIELPGRLIKLYTWPGDVVADLHAGVGTTLRAAKMLGRKYLGCEIDPKFAARAEREVSQETFTL